MPCLNQCQSTSEKLSLCTSKVSLSLKITGEFCTNNGQCSTWSALSICLWALESEGTNQVWDLCTAVHCCVDNLQNSQVLEASQPSCTYWTCTAPVWWTTCILKMSDHLTQCMFYTGCYWAVVQEGLRLTSKSPKKKYSPVQADKEDINKEIQTRDWLSWVKQNNWTPFRRKQNEHWCCVYEYL